MFILIIQVWFLLSEHFIPNIIKSFLGSSQDGRHQQLKFDNKHFFFFNKNLNQRFYFK